MEHPKSFASVYCSYCLNMNESHRAELIEVEMLEGQTNHNTLTHAGPFAHSGENISWYHN
jgi:hypothetical protein